MLIQEPVELGLEVLLILVKASTCLIIDNSAIGALHLWDQTLIKELPNLARHINLQLICEDFLAGVPVRVVGIVIIKNISVLDVVKVVHELDLAHVGFELSVVLAALEFLVEHQAKLILDLKGALDGSVRFFSLGLAGVERLD